MPPRAVRSARGAARPRRRIRLDNDQRRAQLLELAKRAFSDRSYDEVSIDDLAKVATRGQRRPRVRLDNDARRAQLLLLARRAFSDRSYDEVSIDDLAREAKISKGLLYHYFPTKRDLYVAGLREIADALVEAVILVSEDLPPVDRIR